MGSIGRRAKVLALIGMRFCSFEEAEARISVWIEEDYNRLYVHSALGYLNPGGVCSAMGSITGSYIAGSSNMTQLVTAAFKSNDMDYFCEKNSIFQCEKKRLAFRGSLQTIIDGRLRY